MEGDGAVFINSLAWIVRAGEVPVLTDTAWDFWNRFYFYYLKRTPGAIAAYREAMNFGPTLDAAVAKVKRELREAGGGESGPDLDGRSEENTSETQSLMRISYAHFCFE